jgi:uncharacterized protein
MPLMQWPLLLAALALGLAATPHCALMCGAPCVALTRPGAPASLAFHAARLVGYSAAGAVVASSVAALGLWSELAPAMRPLWTLLHLAFLALGLWWLLMARQPAWLLPSRAGVASVASVVTVKPPRSGHTSKAVWRAGGAGLAWVAWPCVALQGALLLAALANTAAAGALVMALFALASAPGLAAAPWAWSRWLAWRGQRVVPADVAAWGYRIVGAGLVVTAAWALVFDMWQRVVVWCVG